MACCRQITTISAPIAKSGLQAVDKGTSASSADCWQAPSLAYNPLSRICTFLDSLFELFFDNLHPRLHSRGFVLSKKEKYVLIFLSICAIIMMYNIAMGAMA